MGFTVKTGSEFEYYVLKDIVGGAGQKGWAMPEPFGYYNEDYHLLQATKAEPLHRLLRNQMTEARIPSSSARARRPPASTRSTSATTDVLESADRTVLFKHGAKEIAYLNGWGITFMAKPDHRGPAPPATSI